MSSLEVGQLLLILFLNGAKTGSKVVVNVDSIGVETVRVKVYYVEVVSGEVDVLFWPKQNKKFYIYNDTYIHAYLFCIYLWFYKASIKTQHLYVH